MVIDSIRLDLSIWLAKAPRDRAGRAAVESDHDGFVDQLVALCRKSGAVHVEEQFHAVNRDAHDLLLGLARQRVLLRVSTESWKPVRT